MNLRKAAAVLAIFLLLLAGSAAVWMWMTGGRIHSSPTATRTDRTYALTHAPATSIIIPTNSFSISTRDTQQGIDISIAGAPPANEALRLAAGKILRADASQIAKIDDGSVRLDWIAMAYAAPSTNFDYSISLSGKLFGRDLKPLSTETVQSISRYERSLNFEGEFPTWKFHFVSSNLPGCIAFQFNVFDARTHYSLTSGTSWWSDENAFYFSSPLRLWHQTPVEIMTTVAIGPQQIYSMSAREGAEIRYPGGLLRVVAITEHEISSWSSGGGGASTTNTLSLQYRPRTEDSPARSTIVFYSWPFGFHLPAELEFVGKDGAVLKTHGGGGSGEMKMVQVTASPGEIETIRVKHYPNFYRLIFTLPELPGLPEENRHVEDLFDVHIPYMRFQYEYEYQKTIADLVQLQFDHFALTFPNGHFPLVRANTTPRELFGELDSLRSNRTRDLYVNEEKLRIEERLDPLRQLLLKARELFAK